MSHRHTGFARDHCSRQQSSDPLCEVTCPRGYSHGLTPFCWCLPAVTCLQEGYLTKKSTKKVTDQKWKRRFMLLLGNDLHYYKSDKDAHSGGKSQGLLRLTSYSKVRSTTYHKANEMELQCEDDHGKAVVLYAYADTPGEIAQWITGNDVRPPSRGATVTATTTYPCFSVHRQ